MKNLILVIYNIIVIVIAGLFMVLGIIFGMISLGFNSGRAIFENYEEHVYESHSTKRDA